MGSITTHQKTTSTSFDWRTAIERKRQERIDRTPKEWILEEQYLASLNCGPTKSTNILQLDVPRKSGILTEKEVEITESYTAVELVEKLREGSFTAVEVTTAFCKRAAIAQQLVSCLTEVFYAEALERAKSLDEYFQREGKVSGPLHGLPISIKDSFCVKNSNTHATVGYASFLNEQPSQYDSALVEMLQNAGAVLYVKTNIPQTMMTGDSENNIFGRTLNPHNTSLTAGGSSGGEGSLVSFRGSVLGVGTDVAGSIRIPSFCCGTYGFKPTTNRVPFGRQISGAMEGLPGPVPSAGPITQSLDDVELFLSTILSSRPEDYDNTAVAVPWRGTITLPSKLRIGVLPIEKALPLHPPVRRNLENAISALEAAGHEIIRLPEIPETSVSLISRLAFAYYIMGPDKSEEHFGPDGEPRVASVTMAANPMFTGPLPVPFDMDPYEKINALHEHRQNYEEAWRKQWVEHKLDVLIAPPCQHTAVPHDTFMWPFYTQIWNMLDYPACIIPCGKVSKEDDPLPNPEDDFGPQSKYIAEEVDGAPTAIQVVTRKFRDEECLAAAQIIDRIVNRWP